MDPNIYFAYLCLTENNHPIRKAFMAWRAPGGNSWTLERIISNMAWEMKAKYRKQYIYQAENMWGSDFSFTKFINFLMKHGFNK